MADAPFELTFAGGESAYVRHVARHMPRFFVSLEKARAAAETVLARFDDGTRQWFPATIRGPGCGPDGITVE